MNKIKGLPTVKQWKKMLEEYQKQKGETKRECKHERRQNLDGRVDGNNSKKVGEVSQ